MFIRIGYLQDKFVVRPTTLLQIKIAMPDIKQDTYSHKKTMLVYSKEDNTTTRVNREN